MASHYKGSPSLNSLVDSMIARISAFGESSIPLPSSGQSSGTRQRSKPTPTTPRPDSVWAIAELALAGGDTVVGTSRRAGALSGLVAAHPRRAVFLILDVIDRQRDAEACLNRPASSRSPHSVHADANDQTQSGHERRPRGNYAEGS